MSLKVTFPGLDKAEVSGVIQPMTAILTKGDALTGKITHRLSLALRAGKASALVLTLVKG
jgi:hypothetical protein